MRRITVLHIITRLDRGGSAQNTLLTALTLDRNRFHVGVIHGRTEALSANEMAAIAADRERLRRAGVTRVEIPTLVRAIRPLHDLHALLRLWQILRRERPHLVHTHTSKAGALGRIAARLAGIPAIVHTPHGHVFHGYYGALMSRLFQWIERRLARLTDRLIALTESERREHLLLGIGSPDRFSVIPSGVDLTLFESARRPDPALRSSLGIAPDAFLVGTVCRLTRIKGVDLLIFALARLRERIPRMAALIIGDGEERKKLEEQCRTAGLSDRVRFLGTRSDIPELLPALDLFLLCSRNEGMGRALVEAMACGKPVVASRVGGIPDVVEEGMTGLLVPPEDPPAVAEAIRTLAADPARRHQMGERGRERARLFSLARMIEKLEKMYTEVLAS